MFSVITNTKKHHQGNYTGFKYGVVLAESYVAPNFTFGWSQSIIVPHSSERESRVSSGSDLDSL